MPRHHKRNCIKSSIGKATNNQITQDEIFKVWENVQNDLEMTSIPKCTFQITSKTNSLLSKKKNVILN